MEEVEWQIKSLTTDIVKKNNKIKVIFYRIQKILH